MTEHSLGDQAQIRLIAEQLVDAAIIKVQGKESVAITPGIKWLAGIMSMLIAACGVWSIKTLNEVQLSVAEIKMQLGQSGAIEARFQDINRRVDRLERTQPGDDSGGRK